MSRIAKIRQVKNFGFFKNYNWPVQYLEDFNSVNLIYGFNGTGKTELSRLLRVLEEKTARHDESHKNAEFIIDSDSTTITESTLDVSPAIKVFNRDFVLDHIKLDEASASSFYHLIRLDPSDEKRLEEFKEEEVQLKGGLEAIRSEKQASTSAKENLLSNTARTIKETLSGVDSYYYNYNRTRAEEILQKYLKDDTELNDLATDELKKQKEKANTTTAPDEISDIQKLEPPRINSIDSDINDLLKKSLSTKTIKSFESDSNLNDWAETGFNLHKTHASNICLYCRNEISEKRQKELEGHFSTEYAELAEEIDRLISVLNSDYPVQRITKTEREFTPEFRAEANTAIMSINEMYAQWELAVTDAINSLREKRKNLAYEQSFTKNLSQAKENLNDALSKMQSVIDKHNEASRSFSREKQNAAKQVENHLVSEIVNDAKKLIVAIEEKSKEERAVQERLESVSTEISSIEKSATGEGPAIEEINRTIRMLLSRSDIYLAPEDDTSFGIFRGDKPAETLSEGEQTAVAFAYFCSKLEEIGSTLKSTILIIDDPISSLDHHRLYAMSSKVKAISREASQTIILTHNYDFFRESKKWLIKKNEELKEKDRDPCANFYFITSEVDLNSNERIPVIQKLPELLQKYDSDYHYNFSEIFNFASNEEDTSKAYHIPSVARKFLETFLSFKAPTSSGLGGLSKICSDTAKQDTITRYLNFSNHADYIERITKLDHATISGARDAVKTIIEVAEEADEPHINELKKISNS